MTTFRKLVLASLLLAGSAGAHESTDINCTMCKDWNEAQKPFRVHGNTWYVGTTGLSAILVTGPQGHILLDGALPQSAPLIENSIRELGFRIEDVKLILNSHEHFDHAGGIAALQRASGATVVASAVAARALMAGTVGKDDPQFDAKEPYHSPKVASVKVVRDGEQVRVGKLVLTANMTPGHTPGGTTWSWKSCDDKRCLDVVYADSLNAMSADGFRFTGDATHPDISASFKASVARVAQMKCDVALSVHPGFTNTFEKLTARTAGVNPFVDPNGCRAYAADASARLTRRLAREQVGTE